MEPPDQYSPWGIHRQSVCSLQTQTSKHSLFFRERHSPRDWEYAHKASLTEQEKQPEVWESFSSTKKTLRDK